MQARVVVDMALVEVVLGPPKYSSAAEELSTAVSTPGVAAGLVWTAAGGGVQCVECVAVTRGEGRSEGTLGQLTLTGQVREGGGKGGGEGFLCGGECGRQRGGGGSVGGGGGRDASADTGATRTQWTGVCSSPGLSVAPPQYILWLNLFRTSVAALGRSLRVSGGYRCKHLSCQCFQQWSHW